MNTSIDIIKEKLADADPLDGLKTITGLFPGKVVFSTSFGIEDQVIADMIYSAGLPVTVFTLDTGRLFQETYDVMDYTRSKYKAEILTYSPDTESLQNLINTKGPNSFYLSVDNRKECCRIRKIEPLKRALKGMDVWITGLRAEQSGHRASMNHLEWDEGNSIIKYHPILSWNIDDVKRYIAEKKVPYNVLHDKGFPSIGCAPCTRAVLAGEDFRAGRWWWEASHKECGLHASTNSASASTNSASASTNSASASTEKVK